MVNFWLCNGAYFNSSGKKGAIWKLLLLCHLVVVVLASTFEEFGKREKKTGSVEECRPQGLPVGASNLKLSYKNTRPSKMA